MGLRDWLISRHKEHLIVITFDQSLGGLAEITITRKMNQKEAEAHKKCLAEFFKGHAQVFSLHELLPSRIIQDPAKNKGLEEGKKEMKE